MTNNEKKLIYGYISNNKDRLKNEYQQIQTNIRYRNIDVTDCVELMLSKERYDTFCEITKHILILLDIKKGVNYDSEKETEKSAE